MEICGHHGSCCAPCHGTRHHLWQEAVAVGFPSSPSKCKLFLKMCKTSQFRALYIFNMTDCFLCIGPFQMPLVIFQRSCSTDRLWNETLSPSLSLLYLHFFKCNFTCSSLSHCLPFFRNERKSNSLRKQHRALSISIRLLHQDDGADYSSYIGDYSTSTLHAHFLAVWWPISNT